MRKPRKNDTPIEKIAGFRRHLIDGVPVPDLCDEYQLWWCIEGPGTDSGS
jgi:hypothetical protein